MNDGPEQRVGQPHEEHRRGGRSRYVLLPAATFLAGLLLGGALVWVAEPEDGSGNAGPSGEPSPSVGPSTPSTSPPPGSIVVPRACLRAAEAAQELVDLGRDAATALADLDAAALEDVVNRMQSLDKRVRADLQECRQPEAP